MQLLLKPDKGQQVGCGSRFRKSGLVSVHPLFGTSTIFNPLCMKLYLLVLPSWLTLLSNCQGLPNSKWHASIITTSHQTESLYREPIENVTRARFDTLTSPHLFSHANLYGLGCCSMRRPNFCMASLDAIFSQLPESIMKQQTLFPDGAGGLEDVVTQPIFVRSSRGHTVPPHHQIGHLISCHNLFLLVKLGLSITSRYINCVIRLIIFDKHHSLFPLSILRLSVSELSTLEALRSTTARTNASKPRRTPWDSTNTTNPYDPTGSCNGDTSTEHPAADSLLLSFNYQAL
ncbi:hypothetical protein CRG98_028383 [Punica granatum]|uniref:Uncharacterized protein n=1 Tax=Punica granatum TaxID=22663 RepID=A0A2I0J4T6_PUNGR|nr:hypothetical protein CRG98_028383 [Punica granatum]